ncbi:MAG TPA: tetratricopeptide repeat protein, partial [Cyclobacteriaceae bacterium]
MVRLPYLRLLFLICLSIPLWAQEVTESWKELDEKGTKLFEEENYEDGLEVFIKAVAAAKKEFGINHATYASTLQSLAVLQLYTGNLEESEKSFMQALEIHQRVVGKNNIEYESFLNGVVSLYLTMGDNVKALKYHEESHQVVKQVHGVNSDEYLTSLKELADRYLDNGYNDKAFALLLEGKGLAINKSYFYGNFCTRLFQLYAEQGDAVKAEPYFVEAKRVRNKSQEELWKTVDFKNMTYTYQIDDQDARLVYWKDLVRQLKEQDAESVEYARALLNLSLIYQTQEDYTQSESVLMEAKAIIEKTGTENDQSALYTNLAYFYDNMGNAPLSLHFYQEQMKAARNANGRDHINYGTACQNQSIYYLNHGDPKKGELLAKTGLLI